MNQAGEMFQAGVGDWPAAEAQDTQALKTADIRQGRDGDRGVTQREFVDMPEMPELGGFRIAETATETAPLERVEELRLDVRFERWRPGDAVRSRRPKSPQGRD